MREKILYAYREEFLTISEIASMYKLDPKYVIEVIRTGQQNYILKREDWQYQSVLSIQHILHVS